MKQDGQIEFLDALTLMPAPIATYRPDDDFWFENAGWRDWIRQSPGLITTSIQLKESLSKAVRRFLSADRADFRTVSFESLCFNLARIRLGDSELALISPTTWHADPDSLDAVPSVSASDPNGIHRSADSSMANAASSSSASPGVRNDSGNSARHAQSLALSVRYFGLGLWEFDPNTNTGWYSSEISRMRGASDSDWNGTLENGIESVHPDDRPLIQNRLRSLAESDEPYDIQIRITSDNGGYRWIRSCAVAIRDDHGKAIRIVGAVQDIDAAIRQGDDLKVSQERLRSICDHAPVLIGIGNESAGLHYVNIAWQDVTGAGREDLLGTGWQKYVLPDDRAILSRVFASKLPENAGSALRFQIQGADGSIHQLAANWSTLPEIGTSTPDVILVATDVTTQHQTAERLTLALDVAGAGMWDWRVADRKFVATKRLFTIIGEPHVSDELPYEWFVSRVHPDDAKRVLEHINSAHNNDAFEYDQQFRMKHARGDFRWIRSKGRVVERDADGQPIRMIGLHVDITEQKETESVLRGALHEASENRNRLSEVLRHAPAAIAIFDMEMRFLAVSERWRRDYELEGVTLIGRCVYDVMRIPDRWRDVHVRCLAGATERCEEDFWVKPNGQKKWERWEVRPWYHVPSHRIGGISIFTDDITSRKQAEAELAAHVDRLTHFSKINIVDQVGLQIAHDLRHPIATLLNQTHVARESIIAAIGDNHPILDEIDDIQLTSLRMSELIDNLRSFAVRSPLAQSHIVVSDVIKSTIRVTRTKADSAGIVILFLDESNGATILGDSTQIQQVLINLVLNGIESIVLSGASAGKIKICAKKTDLTHILIVICDSGPGFESDSAERAFERFHTTKPDGLGIGLSICRRIVDAHGGSIFFSSLKPAEVCLRLPLAVGEESDD